MCRSSSGLTGSPTAPDARFSWPGSWTLVMLLVFPWFLTPGGWQGRVLASARQQTTTPVELSLPQVTADPGDVLDLSLSITTTAATRAIQFEISFDPAVLRCESITEGTFYSGWAAANGASTFVLPVPACDNSTGTVTLMGITLLGGTGGPSGEGSVAAVRFTALADGGSPLALSQVIVADDSPVSQALETTLVNGQVTVGEPLDLEDTVLRVVPPAGGAGVGQELEVNIAISTLPPTRGAQFGLEFDPALLRCEGIAAGPFYNDWAVAHGGIVFVAPVPSCDNANGIVTVMGIVILTLSGADPGGPTGAGTVATVKFTSLAEGDSPVSLTDVIVADDSPASLALPTSVINGIVTIQNRSLFLPVITRDPSS